MRNTLRDIAALTYKEATREPVVTEAREIFAILDGIVRGMMNGGMSLIVLTSPVNHEMNNHSEVILTM